MHSSKKDPVILYFIAGSMPNSREMSEIFMLGSNVRVRNGVIAEHTAPGAIETCDGVSGDPIPVAYRRRSDGKGGFEPMPEGEDVLYAMRKAVIDELRAQEAAEPPQQQQQSEDDDKLNAEAAAAKAATKPPTEGKPPKADPAAASAWVPQK